jgi:hypothetical protein
LNALLKILTLRFTNADVLAFGKQELAIGLIFTWLVGMGRYWDNPKAELLQKLGVGSVIYVFVLALLIWLIVLPLRRDSWRYFHVLIFVTLVSPPAILYAIPVERWTSLETAREINIWFLAVVAIWRVVLLFVFLKRFARLNVFELIITALLPLTFIISSLALLNLEHVVFDIMAGLSQTEATANDSAYVVVLVLTYVSVIAFPFLLAGYLISIYLAWRKRKHFKIESQNTTFNP